MFKHVISIGLFSALLTGVAAAGTPSAHIADAGHSAFTASPAFAAHHNAAHPSVMSEQPAKLGVAISAVSQGDLDNQKIEYGVLIEQVAVGSVAETAGLRPGDVITAINGRPAYSPERLQHLVESAQGKTSVALLRDGESMDLKLAFAEPQPGRATLGVRIQAMTADLKDAFGTDGDAGVLVSQVMNESAASKAGLKAGDVITSVGEEVVTAVDDIHRALGRYRPGDNVVIGIVRERKAEEKQLTLDGAAQGHHYKGTHAWGMMGHVRPNQRRHGERFHGSDSLMKKHGCDMPKGHRRS